MKKPKALVLKTDGINRDEEMTYALSIAGADAKIVHINDLRNKNDQLKKYHILALPGGFAYGDDIASGKILAVELTSFFREELKQFIDREETATIGVCNGFQALVRTGLLPFGTPGTMETTLTNNDSGHFECRWIYAKVEDSKSKFLRNMVGTIVSYPIAHGEGKFFADTETIKKIEEENLVAFRYVDEKDEPTQAYPMNPNGAINAIMGVTDPTGRILGLMPHPECFVRSEQHPNWRRMDMKAQGLPIFKNIVSFVKNS